jgi:DNA (cytosine-5)-methyltransferase 1
MATSKKSTGKKSKNPMSSVGVTHVSLSVRQVSGEVKKTRGICGHGSEQPLANYDPDTQSWKMYGDISLWGDCPLLVNLPISGMTQNGVLFLQHPWEPITGETESLLWPTPTTQEVEHPQAELTETGRRKSKNGNTSHSLGLADAVQMWPTPTVDDSKNVNPKPNRIAGLVAAVNKWPTPVASDAWTGDLKSTQQTEGSRHSLNLSTAVQKWPTPTASDWKGRGPNSKQQGLSEVVKYPTMSASGMGNTGSQQMLQRHVDSGSLTEEEKRGMTAGNGGRLNPTWVEWLMGFPTGWTDLEDSETP